MGQEIVEPIPTISIVDGCRRRGEFLFQIIISHALRVGLLTVVSLVGLVRSPSYSPNVT